MKKTLLLSLTFVQLFLCGCAELGPIQLIDEQTVIPKKKAILFFVDGMGNQKFNDMLQSGQLPNIDEFLIQRGCRIENTVTAVPSITYAVTATFATGLVPGHHGVLGNMYFDRDRLKFIDYDSVGTYRNLDLDYHAPNFYEILDDRFTVTIQTPLRRGAWQRIDNWATSGTCWFLKLFETVDRWTVRRFSLISRIARHTRRWPALIHAYFPATDEYGHRYGPDTEKYRHSLLNVDRQIGHVCRALEVNNLLEDTYLILISDHGMIGSKNNKYIDIKKLIEDSLDLEITEKGPDQRKSLMNRFNYFDRFDVVLANGPCRRIVLYLKNGPDWTKLPDRSQIDPIADLIVRHPGIDLLAHPHENGGVIIRNAIGSALIERKSDIPAPLSDKLYRYKVIGGADPLGYKQKLRDAGLIDGRFHPGRVWLRETVRTEYPDLPVQIVEMFDSRRAGDLIVFAKENWDFDPELIGGHGGVLAGEMVVPMVFAGPGIVPGRTLETARTVDLAPTLIDLLAPEKMQGRRFDGQSLLPKMK